MYIHILHLKSFRVCVKHFVNGNHFVFLLYELNIRRTDHLRRTVKYQQAIRLGQTNFELLHPQKQVIPRRQGMIKVANIYNHFQLINVAYVVRQDRQINKTRTHLLQFQLIMYLLRLNKTDFFPHYVLITLPFHLQALTLEYA